MKRIYNFFEIVYYKFNCLKLKGQSEDDNAFFTLMLFSLIPLFNMITLLTILELTKVLYLKFTNSYQIIAMATLTMFINYLLFFRKGKYKLSKVKYLNFSKSQRRNMNFYFWIYIILTILSYFAVVFIKAYLKKNNI